MIARRRGATSRAVQRPGQAHPGAGDRAGAERHVAARGPVADPAGRAALPYVAGPRIGITKAAELPWRFCAAGCRCVSRPWPVVRVAPRRAGARLARHSAASGPVAAPPVPAAFAASRRCRRAGGAASARAARRVGAAVGAGGAVVGAASPWAAGPSPAGRRRGGGGRRRGGGARRRHDPARARRRRRRDGRPVAALVLGQRVHLQQRHHERAPDLAGKVPPATGVAAELGLHRLELVRIADPDGDGVVLRPAHEPGVAVVLGGAGLARRSRRPGSSPRCRCRSGMTVWRIESTRWRPPA